MEAIKSIVNKVSVPSEKKTKQKEYLPKGTLPIIDQGQALIGGYTNDETKTIICDLPVIVFGDHTCCVKYIDFPFGAGADGIKVIKPKEGILPKYLYYGLQYLVFRLSNRGYGRHYQHIEKMSINVPPISQQERIISQIEESLSQLDSAAETLKKTKQQLEVYRQAVLKEAFSFESAEQIVEVSQITDSIRIGPFGTMLHKSDYVNDGIPVINPQHIKNGVIVPSSKNSISVEKAKELSNYQLKTNDIIMGRRGEMGRSAPITDIENGWLCGTGSIFFRLKPDFDASLYSKILSSPSIVHYLEENATGTTMKNLNEDIVSHMPVPYIDKPMQNKIMQHLEEQLSVCDGIETTIYQSLQQAEALRQSILKQAFEEDKNV